MGIELAVSLLLEVLKQAGTIGALIDKARTEGRDLTKEELDTLSGQADASSTAVKDAIKAAAQ